MQDSTQLSLLEFQSLITKDVAILQLLKSYNLITSDDLREVMQDEKDQVECDSDIDAEIATKKSFLEENPEERFFLSDTGFLASGKRNLNIELTKKKIWDKSARPAKFADDPNINNLPNVKVGVNNIYGFRNADLRQTFKITPNGELVYFGGKAAIVYDRKLNTQRIFQNHSQQISCMTTTGSFFATGELGEDPCIHIWDYKSLQAKLTLQGYLQKGISHLCFSHDGKKLAAIDVSDSHTVVVYDFAKILAGRADNFRDAVAAIFKGPQQVGVGHQVVYDMKFDHNDAFLLFACKRSLGVASMKQEHPEIAYLTNWAGNNCSLLCIESQPHAVIAGLQSGQIIAFKSIEKSAVKPGSDGSGSEINFAFDTILVDQHKGPCACIWPTKKNKGFLTAGFDGSVIQWDAFLNKVHKFYIQEEFPTRLASLKIKSICEDPLTGEIIVGTRAGDILEIDLEDHQNSMLLKGHKDIVTGIDCLAGKQEIVTVGKDGYLVVRDYEKKKHKLALKLEYEASQVASNIEGNHVAVGFYNGLVQIIDINNTAILLRLFDQKSKICILRYSSTSNNYLLATAAFDGRIIFYRADYKYMKIAEIDNIQAPPLSLDFSEDARAVLVVNMNFTLNIFTTEENSSENARIIEGNTKRKTDLIEAFKNENWQTWSSPFAWYAQGLLIDKESVSLFSCLQRSPDKKFLAVGLLNGNVRFYRFPCLGQKIAFLEYKVHAGPVAAIVFPPESNKMFTLGKTEGNIVHWSFTLDDDSFLPSFRYTTPQKPIEESLKLQKPVLTLSDQSNSADPELEKLSKRLAEAPDQNLDLKHVFGFNNNFNGQFAAFTMSQAVIFVSGNKVAIEEYNQNQMIKTQSFFAHHKADITSLDLHKQKDLVVTGDADGNIMVWDYRKKTVLSHLKASQTEGVTKLKFSPDGNKIVVINGDARSTLDVFDQVNMKLVNSIRTNEANTHSVSFSSEDEFITATPDRLRFWQFKGANITSSIPDWRPLRAAEEEIEDEKKKPEPEYLTTATFAFTSNRCLTGTSKGRIYLWENGAFLNYSKTYSNAPITMMICYRNVLYVSSADGQINTWVEGENRLILDKPLKTALPQSLSRFGIRSLDIASNGAYLYALIGTDNGKLFVSEQMDEDTKTRPGSPIKIVKEPTNLVPKGFQYISQSHSGTCILALASHQQLPFFVTSGDDGKLILWNAAKKSVENIFEIELNEKAADSFTAIDWSADGEFIVAGTKKGSIYVFDRFLNKTAKDDHERQILKKDIKELIELKKEQKESYLITTIKISNNPYQVAYTLESSQSLHLLDFNSKKGELSFSHSIDIETTARALSSDWTIDGAYLGIAFDSNEQIFVEVKEGKVSSYSSVRDKKWLTWTQNLGPLVKGVDIDHTELKYFPVCRSFKYEPKAKETDLEFDLNPVKMLLVSGDKTGRLSLYKYPSVHKKSNTRSYNAVSRNLTHVRIFANDEFIVAVGNANNSIVIFETDFKNNNKAVDNIEQILLAQNEEIVVKIPKSLEILPKMSNPNYLKLQMELKNQPKTVKSKDKNHWMNFIVYPTNYLKPTINGHIAPKLTIEPLHVFGFRSKDTRDNLKYLSTNEIIYTTASLVVIQNVRTRSQRYFSEHKTDVTCFSVRPLDRIVASGDLGSPPTVHLWGADSLSSVGRYTIPNVQGLAKLQFSTYGPLLGALSIDPLSTITVLNFETGFVLFSIPGDGPSQRIHDLLWTSGSEFATVGHNHVKFWEVEDTRIKDSRRWLDPKIGNQVILCCAVNRKELLAGNSTGDLLVWRKGQKATDYPQMFSIFSGGSEGDAIEMICVSDQK